MHLQVNLSGEKPEKLSHSSTLPKMASGKNSENSSKKMITKSLEKQGQAVKVTINSRKGSNLKPLYPPSGKSVVVVESITKAKVIQGYLGDMFEVLPSNGHVRDLAARSGSVRPDEDFSMVWEVPSPAWTHLKSIRVALSRYHFSFHTIIILLCHQSNTVNEIAKPLADDILHLHTE